MTYEDFLTTLRNELDISGLDDGADPTTELSEVLDSFEILELYDVLADMGAEVGDIGTTPICTLRDAYDRVTAVSSTQVNGQD